MNKNIKSHIKDILYKYIFKHSKHIVKTLLKTNINNRKIECKRITNIMYFKHNYTDNDKYPVF